MMNPWDRRRTWVETQPAPQRCSGNWVGRGLLMLLAAGIGLAGVGALLSRGARPTVAVPVVLSLVFLGLYVARRRRESIQPSNHCIQAKVLPAAECVDRPAPQGGPVALPVPSADDMAMRKVFDRFDVRAIERARRASLAPAAVASFLDFARDFVDRRHVAALLDHEDGAEVERHVEAAIERALLQFELQGGNATV